MLLGLFCGDGRWVVVMLCICFCEMVEVMDVVCD